MPFSHFRGGLKPPRHCTSGFTLNGFTRPVDAHQHGRPRIYLNVFRNREHMRHIGAPGLEDLNRASPSA